jgi:hypothetical protein
MILKFELNTKKNITAIRALTVLVLIVLLFSVLVLTVLILSYSFFVINWIFLEVKKLTGELDRY